MNVRLIGSMGSGKSTIGRLLAARLRLPFVDLDEAIVQRAGKSIPDIFSDDGECIFRTIEGEVLSDLCSDEALMVLATGGGAVMTAPNRERLKAAAKVIWLYAEPEILASRIRGDRNRPLLNDVNPLTKARELALQRNPIYETLADLKVDTGTMKTKKSVEVIMSYLSECDHE